MPSLSLAIRHESPADDAAIERLHARAFGPGRYARTAFRLREGGGGHDPSLSFAAHVGTFLVGSIRQTPVEIQAKAAVMTALMLGPLTVDPAFEGRGIGGALMQRAIEAARAAGHDLILLVGDGPYYARFGFRMVPMGQLVLPGPVNPERFLALELMEGALAARQGAVMPKRRMTA
jgi:predicted N-acetyltransferase YhbS